MINKDTLYKNILYGFYLRLIITLIILSLLKLIIKKQGFNSSCKVNLNLILPLILFLLDGVDEIPPLINLGYKNKKRACKTFRYQSLDKINDLLSYILTCIIFRLDKYFIFFIMIRTIGVSLFLKYRKVRYLILFPDFMKEYLLYRYFFCSNDTGVSSSCFTRSRFSGEACNNKLLLFFYICKICIEYYWHIKKNKGIF